MAAKMTQQQSDALRIAVLLATVMVVMRHGVNLHHYYIGGHQWIPAVDANIFIQRFISHLTGAAVPAFFLISGFLFFLNVSGMKDIWAKQKRRVHSLLIPYCVWNSMFIILWSGLSMIPVLHAQMVYSFKFSFCWQWFAARLTLHPVVGQFWYIRTLMIFCIFTPVLWIIYRSRIVALIGLVLLGMRWWCIDTSLFSSEGMFFFYCGGLIGSWRLHENIAYSRSGWLSVPVVCFGLLAQIYYWSLPFNIVAITIFASLIMLMQICLFLADHPHICSRLIKCSHYSFFIFALHGCIGAASSLLLSRVLPHTPWYSFCSYVFCVCIGVSASLGAALVLKRVLPRFYSLLSGGRG